jgi:hypothetical protein
VEPVRWILTQAIHVEHYRRQTETAGSGLEASTGAAASGLGFPPELKENHALREALTQLTDEDLRAFGMTEEVRPEMACHHATS